MSHEAAIKPKIAISACLMGAEVRFNGGHKQSQLCSRTLVDYFDFVPVCPEVAIGLGIPREPIRLVGNPERIGSRGMRSEEHTSELQSLMRISYAVFCSKKKKTRWLHPHRQYKRITTNHKC